VEAPKQAVPSTKQAQALWRRELHCLVRTPSFDARSRDDVCVKAKVKGNGDGEASNSQICSALSYKTRESSKHRLLTE